MLQHSRLEHVFSSRILTGGISQNAHGQACFKSHVKGSNDKNETVLNPNEWNTDVPGC